MNIAVCEDNAADCQKICDYIKRHCDKNCFVCEIRTFDSGEALLSAFEPGAYNAIFLDIYMGELTGMETARQIRRLDDVCALVFITVSKEHALESYSVRAASFVVKPIEEEAMDTALLQCHSIFLKNARYIEVMSDRQTVKVPLSKISYVEVLDKDSLFHTDEGIIKTHMPLNEIEKALGGSPFLRCHRACLVNMNHVNRVCERNILMKSGAEVPMRYKGRTEIKMAMAEFTTSHLFGEG